MFSCETHYFFRILLYLSNTFFWRRQWHPTLAWKIPWMEEPGGPQSMGSLRVGHNWATSLSLFTFMHRRRKWQPHSSVFAWRIPGMGEPGGLPSIGSHRVGHDWSDLAAAAAAAYVWLIAVQQKLAQHCKATIFQYFFFKKTKERAS